jgi:hypothetical protein
MCKNDKVVGLKGGGGGWTGLDWFTAIAQPTAETGLGLSRPLDTTVLCNTGMSHFCTSLGPAQYAHHHALIRIVTVRFYISRGLISVKKAMVQHIPPSSSAIHGCSVIHYPFPWINPLSSCYITIPPFSLPPM